MNTSPTSLRSQVSDAEWQLRVDLAACYRLVALYGWTDLVFTHISARLPDAPDQFLINPYGLMFDEITASNLVKVDHHGRKLVDSPHPVNPAGFTIHSCIHAGRPDVHCVLHTHSRAGVAVSAQSHGLLPISQQSTFVLPALAYHDYEGVALREDEQPRLQASLGQASYLMLRNHGLLTVGGSVAEAFLAMYTFENACRIQIDALSAGIDQLRRVDPRILDGMAQVMRTVTAGMGAQIAWPALLRRLERESPGYAQ
ncbi:class II aldolase/adducin family protein [Pelomonas sp. CA6]|uniref:class II aldolase/adducin family protein n=1 Tax=Pelomonas sp. CA6 TaxID=2907999 RepID=UPI001F4C1202|nr:class II aldolase/adducin family protein [Pelomonas sp. CA6]MCH7345493.1 class II aldolase/adducin family protein [Pelomonas sp. CA6]